MAKREKTFVLAWLDAVAHADIPTAAKAVALAMATHADYGNGKNMRAGTVRLAWMAGLAQDHGARRTRAMIKELRDHGFITWDGVPTAVGRARNYDLTIPNGGSRVPPSKDQRWQKTTATVAKNDSNGGSGLQPTKALPGPDQGALRAAPDGRGAAHADIESPVTQNKQAIELIQQAMGAGELHSMEVQYGRHDNGEQWAELTGYLSLEPLELFIAVELAGDSYSLPKTICMNAPIGTKISSRVRNWLGTQHMSGTTDLSTDSDEGVEAVVIYLHESTSLDQVIARLPSLVKIWATECAGESEPGEIALKLSETQCTPELINQLRAILSRHRGATPVHIKITDSAQPTVAKVLQLSDDLHAHASMGLYADLKQLMGPDCLS